MNFGSTDYFIVLDNTGKLLFNPAEQWQASYYNAGNATAIPGCGGITGLQIFYIYGLDNTTNNTTGAHSMPFNRVDYYLDNTIPGPTTCAAGTYTLYRSAINQPDGKLVATPLIDCVWDFQVAFGLDPSGAGTAPIQWQQNLTQQNWMQGYVAGAQMNALQVQMYLREVRVFVLFQDGLGNTSSKPSFQFSGTLNLGDQDVVGASFQQLSSAPIAGSLSSFTPSSKNVQQYRWKIVEISAKPMNLFQWETNPQNR
jgi:hypothetical protein